MPKRKTTTNSHERKTRRTSQKRTNTASAFPAPIQTPGQSASRKAFAAFEAHHETCGWWDDYAHLRNEGFTWRVAAYIAWASSPVQRRWPATLKELAGVLGLKSDKVIYKWRNLYPEIEERVISFRAEALMLYRRDVINALIDVASTPIPEGHQDRKLYFEMVGDYRPRAGLAITGANDGPLELNVHDDDINTAIERELARVADRGQAPDAAEVATKNESA
jgi:hypothetical protein